MKKEQLEEIKRICGILEELEHDLDSIETQLEKEWQEMDGDTQCDNVGFGCLIDAIHDMGYTIQATMKAVMDKLEDVFPEGNKDA